ncbi:flagellar assembly protein H [Novipirellula aureliae]|uniref:Flagellar assembly protein FliH n=1 Tax=Novipirellula aureliae TaxID=2527966 RepID=A0A5C6EEH2_9BACT|nr:FliH/SctL family protein [Novipirellula aureliae]TWU45946.1 flagellar assembly protein H [Novipirellula aureliae]
MATVLKSDRPIDPSEASRKVSGLAGFNLDDFADQGRIRIEQCKAEIQNRFDEARKEAELIRKQAHEKGYAEGLEKAARDSDQRVKQEAEMLASQSLATIHEAVKQLHETYDRWMQEYRDSLSAIAISASEKVIKGKLGKDAGILLSWADEAVRSTRSATRLTLAVHPETLANLGQAFDDLLASPDLPEQTMVEPDESVAIDSVVVRQPGGEIRAGLEDQLDQLRELLS